MATKPICKIDGCSNTHEARGFCKMHYARWKRHGDPKRGRVAAQWEWLQSAARLETDECIVWPFNKTRGYGRIMREGRYMIAHRVVCEIAHGSPHQDELQAAHKCGNPSCVNHRHLYWATPLENAHDKREHGSHPAGEVNGNAKLDENDVSRIRSQRKAGRTYQQMADDFGVSRATIAAIAKRRTWRHIP